MKEVWQETDETISNISLLRRVFGSIVDDTTQRGFAIQPTLLQPKSVGEIYLNINDPYSHPLIDPRYLSDSYDIEILKRGVNVTLQIMNTSAFYGKRIKLTAVT